jgi:Serine phosphatase RsbU, regulator of sigma subunit
MTLLAIYSFAFVLLFVCPLWFDANRRHEYGSRPKILFASMMAFLAIGIIDVALVASGIFSGPYAAFGEAAIFLCLYLYNIVFLLAEYSVHHQRIQKNLLVDEFRDRTRVIYKLAAIELVCLLAFVGVLVLKLSRDDMLTGIFSGVASLLCFLAAAGFSFYCLELFDLEEGIIRKQVYPFRNGMVLIAMLALVFFFRWAKDIPHPVFFTLVSGVFILLNANFAVRVFQEYFVYRMHHLSSNFADRQKQDALRTELINKVLVSSPKEDVEIIHGILAEYLGKIQTSVPNPNVRSKSMMLFRRNGDIMSVDSPELIIDHCVPLMNLPSMKRMKSEDLQEYILQQVFDVEKLSSQADESGLDFGALAVRKLISEKSKVSLNDLPEYLSQMFRLIVLFPVYNQNNLNAILVIFKDTSDYVFPQETVLIDELLGLLSIATTQIAGKKIQEEKNRLNQEMNVAKNIQVSVLPKEIRIDGYDIDSEMITATEVGGDLYDYLPTKFGNYFDIADVAGHGLPAGGTALLHMAAFHGALRASEFLGTQLETSDIYDIVNKVLIGINRDRIGSDKFMTCNMLFEKDGTFKYAGAHMVALVYRAATGSLEEMSRMIDHAAYLGISEYAVSASSAGSFSLASGDVLILYTDGLTESRDNNDRFFGLENLGIALKGNASRPAREIKASILDSLAAFSESGDLKRYGGSYADDVSILVIKRN